MFGLKVRGQRTRTTGRKGGAVGVAKGGKIMPTKGGAGAPPAEGTADATKDAAGDADAPAAKCRTCRGEKKSRSSWEIQDCPSCMSDSNCSL